MLFYSESPRLAVTTLHAIRCSSSLLAAHVHKALRYVPPDCACGYARYETTDHYMFGCHSTAAARAALTVSLRAAGVPRNAANILLGDNTAAVQDAETAQLVYRAFTRFVLKSRRFNIL